MVLHQALALVDFAIAVEPPIVVLSPPLANEWVGVAEIHGPEAWPICGYRKAIDEVMPPVPTVVDRPLGLNPTPMAQPVLAWPGQRIQLVDVLGTPNRPVLLLPVP